MVIVGRANLRLSWSSPGGVAFDKDGFGMAGFKTFVDLVDCWLDTLRALSKGLKTGGSGIERFFGICLVVIMDLGGPAVAEVGVAKDDFEVEGVGAKLGVDSVEAPQVVEALAFFFGKEGVMSGSRPAESPQSLVHPRPCCCFSLPVALAVVDCSERIRRVDSVGSVRSQVRTA